jgi:hypothetical protein
VGEVTVSWGTIANGEMTNCPVGYKCPQGSEYPIECDPGYYSWNLNADECEKCPAGYYCGDSVTEPWESYDAASPNTLGIFPILCPAGSYCPKGSSLDRSNSDQIGTLCPIGTFMPYEGGATSGNCITCPEGYFCDTAGIAVSYADLATDHICGEGKYCEAVSRNPINCPVGAYCPEGSAYYIECPAGTFNDDPQRWLPTHCQACPEHYYCASTGMTSNSKVLCGDGHKCNGGAATSKPLADTLPSGTPTTTGELCPVGYFCSRVLEGQ